MPRRRAPLREQTFRIGAVVAGVVIGLALGAVAVAVVGRGVDLPPAFFVGVVVVTLVFAVGAVALGLVVGSRIVGDRIEIAVREPDGKWRQARLTVGAGTVRLDRYWWQTRFPTGESMDLRVHTLGDDTGRRPQARDWWSVNPQLHIVELETDRGLFEIAALPSHLAELRERLHEPQPQ